jgi:hypothetical protein
VAGSRTGRTVLNLAYSVLALVLTGSGTDEGARAPVQRDIQRHQERALRRRLAFKPVRLDWKMWAAHLMLLASQWGWPASRPVIT